MDLGIKGVVGKEYHIDMLHDDAHNVFPDARIVHMDNIDVCNDVLVPDGCEAMVWVWMALR